MSKVQLLPQNLINQIAAGEVVERPASVVKELVENSLDAGATMIEVSLKRAGRECIVIADNGCGMSPEDARMSLERHATSKIHSFDDLMRVGTMGFRGEALPSIASISYFTLKTSAGAEGFEIRIEGGRKMSEGPCLMPQGTTIIVEHLFYNVPARRKFLKSDATEMGQCVETMRAIALGNPGVGLRLMDGRRMIIDLPANQSVEERLEKLWGAPGWEGLLKITPPPYPLPTGGGINNGSEPPNPLPIGENHVTQLSGFISPIGKTFSTRQKIIFFVNRRPVDAKIFHMALREVYGPGLARGHYPAACVYLTIPSGEIDVNVHPAKREIRFRAEREKLAFLINALSKTLNVKPMSSVSPFENSTNGLPHFAFTSPTIFTPTNAPFEGSGTAIPFPRENIRGVAPVPLGAIATNPSAACGNAFATQSAEGAKIRRGADGSTSAQVFNPGHNASIGADLCRVAMHPPEAGGSRGSSAHGVMGAAPSPSQTFMKVAEGATSRHGWQFLSFLHKEYSLFSTPEGLVILSMSNAQERVAYEKIESSFEKPHSQTLLVPALLQLDGTLEETLRMNKKFIAQQGFAVEPFGKGAYRLEAVPGYLTPENGFHGAPENLLVEELAALSEGAIARGDERLKHRTIARLAAKHARAAISHPEAAGKLVDELLVCKNPLRSPGGAPTFWQINLEEMVKRFLK